MKAWVACFIILFGLAELVLWLKDFFLPLPIYLLGGAFLAIASNSPKGLGTLISQAEHNQTNHSAPLEERAKITEQVNKLPSHPFFPAKTSGKTGQQGEVTLVKSPDSYSRSN